ncbi:hypothetical protein [Martelella sp. HB161492]|uniref:hypothetical protein n=1 Tax=Martelella sp. HB161492 TaxID=2720726 RepID=UPI00158FE913|nr:hypothetical protein [Martelella sp. HB161492]
MPTIAEIRFYLKGLWLLFKGSATAYHYLDFTERGFRRSFWAFVICLPFMVLSSLLSLTDSAGNGVAFTGLLVFRTILIQAVSWIVPLVAIALVCHFSGQAKAFFRIVIASNWLSVPVNVVAAVLIIAIALLGPAFLVPLIILLQVVIFGAFLFEIRLFYVLLDDRPLPTAATILASVVTTLVISDLGTRYMLGG